ncbi:hypothetical protein HDG35_001116 [Paraburkholderia sp. JPY681]|uniref:Uncharacterized protein n=1 Tax=Paraburkholderia atlantica TaxID=2654982 RepID=D5WJK2_PARAM|nr:hypothetical protein BC1002_4681 [Paraburkholderia atlantica]MBB5504881.1 hypothetical protein [Paraburkholderia atlantica]
MAPYATSRLLMLNPKLDENSKPVYKQKVRRENSPRTFLNLQLRWPKPYASPLILSRTSTKMKSSQETPRPK